jgi:replicative DNA helicase
MNPEFDASRALHVIRADTEGRPAPSATATRRVETERGVLKAAADRALAGPRPMFASTGNVWLDDATGGIEPGLNWVVAAQSTFGKSTFAAAIADENLGKRKMLIGSTEDIAALYGERILLRRTRCNATRLQQGRLYEHERQEIRDALARSRELPMFIDWNGATAEQIAADIAGDGKRPGIVQEHGTELILLDWLGKIPTEKRQDDARERVAHAYNCVSRAAKRIGCALVVFSQVTPQQGIPTMQWIRDSKDVGHLADVVVLGLCNDTREPDGKLLERKRRWLIDKCKRGEAGRSLPTGWEDDSASFRPLRKLTQDEPPEEVDRG